MEFNPQCISVGLIWLSEETMIPPTSLNNRSLQRSWDEFSSR